MEARITNGASVNRVWSESANAEFIGAFQYSQDAELFVAARIDLDLKNKLTGSYYVVSDTYHGTIKVFRPPAPSEKTPVAKAC